MEGEIGRLLYYLGVGTFWPTYWVAAWLAFGGIITLIWRAFVLLRDGYWINSLCHLSFDARSRSIRVIDLCGDISTGWIGIDRFAHWMLREVDASLGPIGLAIGLALAWTALAIAIRWTARIYNLSF